MPLSRWIVVSLLAVLLLPSCGPAPDDTRRDEAQAEILTGPGGAPAALLVAGRLVRVPAARFQATTDVFASGATVLIENVTADDAYAAGSAIRVSEARLEDLTAAGRDLAIRSTTIADDLVAAGETVMTSSDVAVGQNAVVAGRQVILAGTVGGSAIAAGREVQLSGQIAGDADLFARRIVFAPGARIGGNLRYPADAELVGAVAEVVAGQAQPLGPTAWVSTATIWFGAVAVWIAAVLGVIILGAALVLLFPGLLDGAAYAVAERPGRSALLGIALLVGAPIAVAFLFATLVGTPLAIVLLALYAAALAAALTAAGLWLGQKLTGQAREPYAAVSTGRRVGAAALGLLILSVVGIVPVLGALVVLAALVTGLGALAAPAWDRLHSV